MYAIRSYYETKSLTHYTKGTPSGLKAPPTACRRPVSETVSLPSSGCFSPFPHGTGSLSVSKEYLAFEGGPPIFRQDFTCPALLNASDQTSYTGLSPISLALRMTVSATELVEWSQVIAMSVVALLPSMIVFFSAQRYFVQGIASTGVKG